MHHCIKCIFPKDFIDLKTSIKDNIKREKKKLLFYFTLKGEKMKKNSEMKSCLLNKNGYSFWISQVSINKLKPSCLWKQLLKNFDSTQISSRKIVLSKVTAELIINVNKNFNKFLKVRWFETCERFRKKKKKR